MQTTLYALARLMPGWRTAEREYFIDEASRTLRLVELLSFADHLAYQRAIAQTRELYRGGDLGDPVHDPGPLLRFLAAQSCAWLADVFEERRDGSGIEAFELEAEPLAMIAVGRTEAVEHLLARFDPTRLRLAA